MDTPEPLPQPEQSSPFPPNWTQEFTDKVKGDIFTAFKQYESAHSEDYERLWRCWEDFNSITKRQVSRLFSNVQLPVIQEIIRILEARIVDAVMASNPLILVEPIAQIAPGAMGDYETMEQAADILQQTLNGLFDAGGGRQQAMLKILDGLIYGRMISKTGWEQVYREDAEGYYPDHEYPVSYRISPFYFMCDPRCRDVQDAVRSFQVIPHTQHDKDLRVGAGFYDKKNADLLDFSRPPVTLGSQYQQRQMESRKQQDTITQTGIADVVECLQRLDPDGNGQATMYFVWFDPSTGNILGARPCTSQGGKRPLIVGYLFPATGDMLYGPSVTEHLHGLARAKSTLLNQYLDNVKLAQARYLVNQNAGINEPELKQVIPGGLIHGAQDISENAVRPFQAQSIGPEILNAMGFINGEIQQASSVTDISQAMKAPSTAFATGLISAQSQSNFDIFATFARESFFNKEFTQLLNLVQRFLDLQVPATIDVAGTQATVWVNRHNLQGRFMAKCSDLRLAGKRQATSQVLTSLLAVLMQTGADVRKVVETILQLNDVQDADQFFPQGSPIQALAAQAGPTGVQGQPNPNDAMPVMQDPNASRLQMKPGPGGDMPMGAASMPMMTGAPSA